MRWPCADSAGVTAALWLISPILTAIEDTDRVVEMFEDVGQDDVVVATWQADLLEGGMDELCLRTEPLAGFLECVSGGFHTGDVGEMLQETAGEIALIAA